VNVRAFGVEVLGRYSNHVDQGTRIERVLEIPLGDPTTPFSNSLRQVHRRLRRDELDELAEAYLAGATLSELSARFRRHRVTISTELERRGVARRYRLVEGKRLQQAIQNYQSGMSVASIGKELGVAGDTVHKALTKAGVKLRPRRGWGHHQP
jgi:IS30 family transposase